MGDRHMIDVIICPYCYEANNDVAYCDSADITTFTCEHCGQESRIYMEFIADRIEDFEDAG